MIRERLQKEWQDLAIQYPDWLLTILDNELYYILTVALVCVNSFVVGLVIGIVMTVV